MIAFSWNADLSTLASVVTSLAGMRSDAFAGVGANPLNHRGSSPADRGPDRDRSDRSSSGHHHHHHHGGQSNNVKMEEDDDSDDEDSASTTNDEAAVANALHLAKENLISKAFDTMAKVSGFFVFQVQLSFIIIYSLRFRFFFVASSLTERSF